MNQDLLKAVLEMSKSVKGLKKTFEKMKRQKSKHHSSPEQRRREREVTHVNLHFESGEEKEEKYYFQ